MNLHKQILNLPCGRTPTWPHRREDYSQGHLDARQAAAEFALKADLERAELRLALRALLVAKWCTPDYEKATIAAARILGDA